MILYPGDYVLYKEAKNYLKSEKTPLLCIVSINSDFYDKNKPEPMGVPIIPEGKNQGWWAKWEQIKKITPISNPEYFL